MSGITAIHKLWATAAIAALVLIAGGWGFGRMSHRVIQSDLALAEIQSRIGASAEERRGVRSLEEILKKRQPDLDRISAFFVPRERPIAFIEQVERLAASTGNSIAIDVDDGRSNEEALVLRFTVEGGEKNMLRYVRLLEAMPYKIEMEEMIFQKVALETRSDTKPIPPARLIIALRVRAR